MHNWLPIVALTYSCLMCSLLIATTFSIITFLASPQVAGHPDPVSGTGSGTLLNAISSTQDPMCSVYSFQQCLAIIKAVTSSDQLAFASTVQDLDAACSKLQEGVRCSDDHMKRCVSKNQRAVFEEVVTGTREVIAKLCVSGPLQKNYLRFASCFKNVSLSEDKCSPWFKTVQAMDTQMKDENVDEGLKKFCCAFSQAYHCQVFYLRRDCGEEAVEFFEENLEQMSNSLIHQHCASYTYDSCLHAGSEPSSLSAPVGAHFWTSLALILFSLLIPR